MSFVKCEVCDVKVIGDKCVFAVQKRIIKNKEYLFCCARCSEGFEKNSENKR